MSSIRSRERGGIEGDDGDVVRSIQMPSIVATTSAFGDTTKYWHCYLLGRIFVCVIDAIQE